MEAGQNGQYKRRRPAPRGVSCVSVINLRVSLPSGRLHLWCTAWEYWTAVLFGVSSWPDPFAWKLSPFGAASAVSLEPVIRLIQLYLLIALSFYEIDFQKSSELNQQIQSIYLTIETLAAICKELTNSYIFCGFWMIACSKLHLCALPETTACYVRDQGRL